MEKKIKNVLTFLILLLASVIIIGSIYYAKEYPEQDFDQVLYYALNGVETAAPTVINSVIAVCIVPVGVLSMLLYIFTIRDVEIKRYCTYKFKGKDKKIQIFPIKITAYHRKKYLIVVTLVALIVAVFCLKINIYLKNKILSTKIFEDYYVDGKNINITFPEQKRNLILIVSESMENTLLSKDNGGMWENSIIPELEEVAIENVNFSNTDCLGGAHQTYGTNYSVAGIVAMTSGIPLKTGDILINKNTYTGNGKYLEGTYALGEVLGEQGYNLEIMLGSDATFGGRRQYLETNGGYKIFDVTYAIEQGKMEVNDITWWGFEDDKLFEWSKEEITNLYSQGQPFNYIMVTADTHFPDGYLSPNVELKHDSQYENVYAYSSKSINEFINWAKTQEFYENTTIVILGDHLGMQAEFYEEKIKDTNYTRTIYNCIINGIPQATNNKNRTFTTMDMYPTILASLGVKIEGERLGLGTNLYSGVPTLAESLGLDNFCSEISKNSVWYNRFILGSDYYEMKKIIPESEGKNEENISSSTNVL